MKYLNLLWANWGKNIISMLMYEKKVQPLQNVLYLNIWKTWYPKLKRIMVLPRNMNWNWKAITNIKNCVKIFTIVRKQSPFNQRKSFCVSFMRRWIIQILFYQGYKWKTKWLLGSVNCQSCSLERLLMGMVMRRLLNTQMNCGPMTLISQLDIFCVYYKLWRRNLFMSRKGYLIMSYKMNHLSN